MNSNGFEINKTLIVDQVYTDIKNRILRGELKPDSKLCVRVLCEYYSISDTPLKQALNRLISEHLVCASPRRGMRVSSFNKKDIAEALETRKMIELFAVDAALEAIKKNNDLISQLKENVAEDERLMKEIEDLNEYSEEVQRELEISQNFHVIFVQALNNQTILDIYKNITNHRYLYYQFGQDKNSKAWASIAEHKAILQKLEAGDRAGLQEAIINHLSARKYDIADIALN